MLLQKALLALLALPGPRMSAAFPFATGGTLQKDTADCLALRALYSALGNKPTVLLQSYLTTHVNSNSSSCEWEASISCTSDRVTGMCVVD